MGYIAFFPSSKWSRHESYRVFSLADVLPEKPGIHKMYRWTFSLVISEEARRIYIAPTELFAAFPPVIIIIAPWNNGHYEPEPLYLHTRCSFQIISLILRAIAASNNRCYARTFIPLSFFPTPYHQNQRNSVRDAKYLHSRVKYHNLK